MRLDRKLYLIAAIVLLATIGTVVLLRSISQSTSIEQPPVAAPLSTPDITNLVADNAPPPPTPASIADISPVRALIWSDDFGAPAGTVPDPAKWNIDTGGGGWGNGEWEYYENSAGNAAQDGQGHLVITALSPARPSGGCAFGPCNITSARLQTDGLFAATYGRIEARIKAPAGQGLWPAFWMLPEDDSGEIDIMENNGRDPSIISGTLHGPGYAGPAGIAAELRLFPGGSAADVFHVYSVDWTAQSIVWSVDGRIFQTIRKGDPRVGAWVFNRPYYILLNLAVGSEDPGYPDESTSFPAKLVIDYVRVYR